MLETIHTILFYNVDMDANLQGANLQGANLRDAYLQGANLRDAKNILVKLTSGFSLSFQDMAQILDWCHNWEIDGDNIVNVTTGTVVGVIVYE